MLSDHRVPQTCLFSSPQCWHYTHMSCLKFLCGYCGWNPDDYACKTNTLLTELSLQPYKFICMEIHLQMLLLERKYKAQWANNETLMELFTVNSTEPFDSHELLSHLLTELKSAGNLPFQMKTGCSSDTTVD